MPITLWIGEAAEERSEALATAAKARTVLGRRIMPWWRLRRLERKWRLPTARP